MEYSFDIDIAGQFGIDEAIFIKNMQFWIIKNKSEGKNLREDRTWTYGSLKNFKRYFPFWTEKQLSGIIRNLLDFDIILKNNFNKIKYDRTIWYAFKDENEYIYKYNKELQHKKESSELENNTDKSLNLTILPNGQMDFTKRANLYQIQNHIQIQIRKIRVVRSPQTAKPVLRTIHLFLKLPCN